MSRSKKAEASLQRVVQKLKQGDLSPVTHIAGLERVPKVPFDKWSYRNRVLAYAQGDSTDLRTMNEWNRLGRKVKKGSSACWIFEPSYKKIVNDDGEETWSRIPHRYWLSPRYRVEDTEGDPLPECKLSYRELPLAELVARLGVETKYVPGIPMALGDTDGKRIHLNAEDPAVWFHEVGHVLHTKLDGGERKGTKGERESVAELTACVLMHLYGYGDRSGNAWKYISMYSTDPIEAVEKAMLTVQDILEFVFPSETVGEDNEGSGVSRES